MQRRGRLRHAAVLMHRWVGLVITLFLLSAGLTGSLLAFNDELEAWISPALFRVVPPADGTPRLGPFELRERVLQQRPGTAIDRVALRASPDPRRTVGFSLAPAPGAPTELANDEVFVDPYTGRIVGERRHGDITQGWKNAMPFVYRLHDSLALGSVGGYALGIAALLWTVDCFVGFCLTLPRRPMHGAKRWSARWAPAWKLRWRGGAPKLTFDLHRAGGLWVWAMLFVLAWSSVGFNLREVYRPVMRLAGDAHPGAVAPLRATPLVHPAIGWEAARALAAAALSAEGRREGFVVNRERLIRFDANRGVYALRAHSSRDVGEKYGITTVFLDATTGRVLRVDLPTGRHAASTVSTWIMALHTATVGGLAMQVAICAMGAMVVMLGVTGLLIWWRKRAARALAQHPVTRWPGRAV